MFAASSSTTTFAIMSALSKKRLLKGMNILDLGLNILGLKILLSSRPNPSLVSKAL